MKKTDFIIIKIGLIIGLVWVLFVVFAKLVLPFSEKMTCGSDYVCHVEQKYLWKTEKRDITLHYLYSYVNSNVSEECYKPRRGGKHCTYSVDFNLNATRYKTISFEFPIFSIRVDDALLKYLSLYEDERKWARQDCENYIQKVSDDFKTYLKNPQKGFSISSQAGGLKSVFSTIIICSFPILLLSFFLWLAW